LQTYYYLSPYIILYYDTFCGVIQWVLNLCKDIKTIGQKIKREWKKQESVRKIWIYSAEKFKNRARLFIKKYLF